MDGADARETLSDDAYVGLYTHGTERGTKQQAGLFGEVRLLTVPHLL